MRVGSIALAFAAATASLNCNFQAHTKVRHQIGQDQTCLNHFVVEQDPVNCKVWWHPVELLEADHWQNTHVHIGHHKDRNNGDLHLVVVILEFDQVRKLHENYGSNIGHDCICDAARQGYHRAPKAIRCVFLANLIFRVGPDRPKVADADSLVVAIALVDARHLCIFQVFGIKGCPGLVVIDRLVRKHRRNFRALSQEHKVVAERNHLQLHEPHHHKAHDEVENEKQGVESARDYSVLDCRSVVFPPDRVR